MDLVDDEVTGLEVDADTRTGRQGDNPDRPSRVGPSATILVRADLSAIRRGHTNPGETCEIDGLGPVSIEALRRQTPHGPPDDPAHPENSNAPPGHQSTEAA